MTEDFQKQLQNIFQSIYSNEYMLELYNRFKVVEKDVDNTDAVYMNIKLTISRYIRQTLFAGLSESDEQDIETAKSIFNMILIIFDSLATERPFIDIYNYYVLNGIKDLNSLEDILKINDLIELEPFRYSYLKTLYNTGYFIDVVKVSLLNLFERIREELDKK